MTTPEHTARARDIIGADAFLAPAQIAALTTDAEHPRDMAAAALDFCLGLHNYQNNWRRIGFTDHDIAKPGSDRFVDALVAHGSPDMVAERLQQHLTAGADHVPVGIMDWTH